ncbi:MAG: TRAP transporter small permease [Spirochaetaceae bacterium]|nr:MAG: TRAP transporter small permease [Spirochaetaceae bacterium]
MFSGEGTQRVRISAIYSLILTGFAVLAAALIASMAVLITAQVVLRYAFGIVLLWVNDYIEYTLLASTLFGSAYLLKQKGHVEIDFFTARLRPAARRVFTVLAYAIGTFVCAMFWYSSSLTTLDHYRRGVLVIKSVAFPKYFVLLPVVIGFTLLTVQFAILLVQAVRTPSSELSTSDAGFDL